METPIPGVFVVKMPKTKTRGPMLSMEVNPLKDDGRPMKRKGLFVTSKEMLEKFGEALNDDKVYQLVGEIDGVNPKLGSGNGSLKKLKM